MKKTDLIRIQCFVTKERHEEIKEYAKQLGLSIDQFCRTTMFNRMDHYPRKPKNGVVNETNNT